MVPRALYCTFVVAVLPQICSNYPIAVSVYHTSTNISTNASYAYTVAPKTEIDNGGVLYTAVPFNINAVYPVNSIYISYSHTSPASLFGGTWTRISGAFLWAVAGDTSVIGKTGGSQTHTLTVNEMPGHKHSIEYVTSGGYKSGITNMPGYAGSSTVTPYGDVTTVTTGGGAAHNNMPPYIQVSVWRRTA